MSYEAYSAPHMRVPEPRFRHDWGLSSATRRQIGWCDAAIESLRESPLSPELQADLGNAVFVEGVTATLELTGGTLTKDDVASVLSGGPLTKSLFYLQIEAQNVAHVARELFIDIRYRESKPLSPDFLRRVRSALGRGLGARFAGVPRLFREGDDRHEVPSPPGHEVPFLVERLCNWTEQEVPALKVDIGGNALGPADFGNALVQSIAVHGYMAWIRPFVNGNGRTARLMETYLLVRAGVPTLAAWLGAVHYAKTRPTYEHLLQEAVKAQSLTAFMSYAIAGYRDGLAALLATVRERHWTAAWRAHVFDRFAAHEHHKTTVMERRRDLALSLPHDRQFRINQVPAFLDPALACTYRDLSERTLQRDLDALVQIGLAWELAGDYYSCVDDLGVR